MPLLQTCQSTNNEATCDPEFCLFLPIPAAFHSHFYSLSVMPPSQPIRPTGTQWSPIRSMALSSMWSRQVNTLPLLPSVGERTALLEISGEKCVFTHGYQSGYLRGVLGLLVAQLQRVKQRRRRKNQVFIFERWSCNSI